MEAGATHRQQHTRDKQSVPIQFNRADATTWLVLAEISDLAPPIISFAGPIVWPFVGPLLKGIIKVQRLKRSGHSDLAMRTKHPRTRVPPIYKASSIRSRIRAKRNVHRSLEGELRKIRTSLKIAGTSAVNSDLAEAQDHSAPGSGTAKAHLRAESR
jgi:hypothetical protein